MSGVAMPVSTCAHTQIVKRLTRRAKAFTCAHPQGRDHPALVRWVAYGIPVSQPEPAQKLLALPLHRVHVIIVACVDPSFESVCVPYGHATRGAQMAPSILCVCGEMSGGSTIWQSPSR